MSAVYSARPSALGTPDWLSGGFQGFFGDGGSCPLQNSNPQSLLKELLSVHPDLVPVSSILTPHGLLHVGLARVVTWILVFNYHRLFFKLLNLFNDVPMTCC